MSFVTKLHIYALMVITLSVILSGVIDSSLLKTIISIHACLLVIILMIQTLGFVKYMYFLFFMLAVILTVMNRIPFASVVDNLAAHSMFIALFVCTPILKLPIKLGNYLEDFHAYIHTTPRKMLQPMIVIQNFSLCSFLNFGAVQVVDEIFRDVMKSQQRVYAQLLSRSYSLGALWTPYFGAFSVAVAYSEGNPASIITLGILLCLLTFCFWLLPLFLHANERNVDLIGKRNSRKMLQLLLCFLLLIVSVVVASLLTNLSVVIVISVISVLFSLTWCMGLQRF